jgi:hypothetical protein
VVDLLKSFETVATSQAVPDAAIADLVDNSIDAQASRVQIRFMLSDGLIDQLVIVDNGAGMTAEGIDTAMQLGRPKVSDAPGLGHFGMGLKAASFSQSDLLTVLSRSRGYPPVGRRMSREPTSTAFEVQVFEPTQVGLALDSLLPKPAEAGTVVLWDDIRTFPKSNDRTVTKDFVEKQVAALRHHLGLTFHRLLEANGFSIDIDVFDTDIGLPGLPFNVDPINPFGYPRSGIAGYPKKLMARSEAKSLAITCHVWPAGSDSHCFKLAGTTTDRLQGFYFYRGNRLLSAGGWNGVTHEVKQRRLARIAIDLDGYEDAVSMSVEKAGVRMNADLVNAIESAEAEDGTTFADYLRDAENTFKESNRRVSRRAPMLVPGPGIAPKVKRAIASEVDCLEAEDPLQIRWKRFEHDDFIEIDRRSQTLWLNSDYRAAVLKGTPAGLNDAPILKTLLFLLFENVFQGVAFGSKDKDNVNLWREVLNAAAEDERDGYGG